MKTILVTGGTGMVGKDLQKIMPDAVYVGSKDYDLTNQDEVHMMIGEIRPDVVVHLAAKVSGIKVPNLMAILSTCIYPDVATHYPMDETMLHQGPPTATNFSYGYAKRCMAVYIDACNKQYGTKYNYLIPCNLYGPNDKFDDRSHFMAALIKKIYDAYLHGEKQITLLGTGKPLRQFMHSRDLAITIKLCIENDIYENMNIAPGADMELSIADIAYKAIDACELQGLDIIFDKTKPDGQYRKTVCNKKMMEIFAVFNFISLRPGIKETFNSYLESQSNK